MKKNKKPMSALKSKTLNFIFGLNISDNAQ